jgi:predicted phosphodiesterase
LADLKRQSPDVTVFLGDIINRGPQPKECLDLVRALHCTTVVGNHDNLHARFPRSEWKPQSRKSELNLRSFDYAMAHISDQDRAWLAALPRHLTLDFLGVQVELFHSTPHSEDEYVWPWARCEELDELRIDPETSLSLFGHMHHAFVRRATAHQVVNSGSVGIPFDGDNRAGYVLIDIEPTGLGVQIRRIEYDVDRSIAAARQLQMPDIDAFTEAVTTARYPYSR